MGKFSNGDPLLTILNRVSFHVSIQFVPTGAPTATPLKSYKILSISLSKLYKSIRRGIDADMGHVMMQSSGSLVRSSRTDTLTAVGHQSLSTAPR